MIAPAAHLPAGPVASAAPAPDPPAGFGGGGGGGSGGGPVSDPITMTTTLDMGGSQDVLVTSTATIYDDHILWQYQVTNESFDGGSYVGVSGFWMFNVTHPGVDAFSDLTNDQGWTGGDSAGGILSGAHWIGSQDDTPEPVPIGGTANFSFTSPLCPIGWVGAKAGEGDLAGWADGQVLGPVLKIVNVDLQMPGVSADHKLDRGGYVPVNANDDNGSTITNEIPTKRDFDANPMPRSDPNNANSPRIEDPDLVRVDINITPNLPAQGSYALSVTNSGAGQIKLWKERTRENRAEGTYTGTAGANPLPDHVYVEGAEPSAALRESEISLVYLYYNPSPLHIEYGADRVKVTVTPVIENLSVDVSKGKVEFLGDPNNQNAPRSGQFGMILSNNPGPIDPDKPGAELKAKVVWNGMPQGESDLVFVQNFTDYWNGAPAGWVMTAQAIQQLQGQLRPQGATEYHCLDRRTVPDPRRRQKD
jgi:hypothetical protein